MKVPLRFQVTEYDCATTTLQNAISFLFKREEIPAEIVRTISLYTLDCYDNEGDIGEGGTSKAAMALMSSWIKNYANSHDFALKSEHYLNEDVNIDIITKCLKKNGCVVLRTYQKCEHYCLITEIDNDFVYLWDPYYIEEKYYDTDKLIEVVFDEPFKFNRKVAMSRFLSSTHNDFALGPIKNRECLCLYTKER